MTTPTPTLNFNKSLLDSRCKSILQTLKSLGKDKAEVSYTIDETVISNADFSHLLRHGGVQVGPANATSFRGVLKKYVQPMSGPEANKIGFQLNINLE